MGSLGTPKSEHPWALRGWDNRYNDFGGTEPSYAQAQSHHTPRGVPSHHTRRGHRAILRPVGTESSYAQGVQSIRPGGYRAIIRHPRWCPLYTILVHWYPVHCTHMLPKINFHLTCLSVAIHLWIKFLMILIEASNSFISLHRSPTSPICGMFVRSHAKRIFVSGPRPRSVKIAISSAYSWPTIGSCCATRTWRRQG